MPAELLPHPAAALSNSPAVRPAVLCRRAGPRWRPATGWLAALLLVLLSGALTAARAQAVPPPPPECAADEKFANTWYFGFKAGLDFNSATDSIPPKVLTDGAMVAPAGSGVMSDKDGKILFYSNGRTVWNGDGTVMTNGRGLAGDSLTTDGPLPIKMPGIPPTGQATRYLLFTLNSTVGLSYSEIDIPAGGGPGTVVAATKNTPLARGTAEKLTGVFHKNGCDIWVIAHGWGDAKTGNDNRGDAFLAYRVRLATGYVGPVNIDAPLLSAVGSLHAASKSPVGYKGQMRVTPDGQRLALARYSEVLGDSSSTVELFGFDTGTGQVSVNPQVPYIVDKGKGKYYGVSFSAGNYLYATVRNPPQLLQFDISGNGPVTSQTIPLKQKTPVDLGAMQAAPDGKIYVARDNQPALGFIAYPDSLGAKARYADDSLQLSGRLSGLGLVNFNQSSLLRVGPSAQITGCRQLSFTAPPIEFDGKTYAWDFGDGATSALENPVHVYATPGTYTVTLRITTACFCRQSSGSILVPNLPVPGSIAASQTLCAGTAPALLTSTASGSSDAGLPLVYQWESSTDNVTFSAVAGATSASYQPGNLAAGTTYFRRRAQLLLPTGSGPYCTPTFTSAVAITVLPALAVGSIGTSQTVCAGSAPAALTSTTPASGGTGTFTYQWEASTDNVTFAAISGATSDTFAPGVLTATTYFRRRVSSGACTAAPSNVVTITVVPALAGGSIAASQALCAGALPSPFSSAAPATGGTGTLAYQWESSLDNTTFTAIGGATGDTYAPGALTATTYFRRRASAGGGCAPAYSNVLTITVAPALAAGTIAADQTLCAGVAPAPLTSTAGASGGTGTVAYQWQSSTDNTNFTDIAGATGATYAPGVLAVTTYFRRQATAGSCGPVSSPVVTLTVLPALAAGSIAADQAVCAGTAPAPLTSPVGASGGTGTFTYQWEASADNVAFATIAGATSATFSPGVLTATTYFRRRVGSGACASALSNVVTITVSPALLAGSIAASQNLCAGSVPSPLTSTASAAGGSGAITYQWEFSLDNTTWNAIGGATAPTYAPGALSATTYYRRRADAGGGCAPAYSNTITIGVAPALVAGTIAADQTLCPGATPAPLTSTARASGGTGSFDYQWQFSTDNATWNDAPGANGADYAPGPLTATTYFRRRVLSSPCGPAYSPVVTLTVLPALVAGTIAADQAVCAGAVPAPLSSAAGASGGTGSFAYQWQSSTNNTTFTDIGGATGATYAPGALTVTTYFRRQVTAGTGTCATALSNVVTIQVQPLVTPTVTLAAPPVQCAGTPLTFTAVVTNAGAAPTFQWFVNNAAVAAGPTFTSSTLATGDVVRVDVTPTAGLCSTGPATASVTVTRTATPAPTLAIVGPSAPLCPGELLTFSISSVTGAGAAPAYQWQVNGADVPGATTPIFSSATLRDGQTVTLRLRTTDACGQAVTAVSNGVVVRILPPVVVSAGPDKEILEGSSVVLEGTADGNYPVVWTPALGLTIPASSPLRPVAAPLVTTTYTLSAGTGGCASSDQVTVTVRPAIRIPNAISPNGDGIDDTWQIDNIELYPENTVNIFNRWGDKIFSAENYSRANEWRGDIKGQPAPVGTYYYVVVTKGPLGHSYAGPITVVY